MTALDFYDREDRPWPGPRMTSAAIVGHTTTTSARIWARVWRKGEFCLLVSAVPLATGRRPVIDRQALTVSAEGLVQPLVFCEAHDFDYATDLTHVFDVTGLVPGTRYHYAIVGLGHDKHAWEIARERPHSFRTARPAEAVETMSFGVFSCHMPYHRGDVTGMNMWRHLHDQLKGHRSDFVIGLGDQVYVDGDEDVDIWRFLETVRRKMLRRTSAERVEIMRSWYRDIYRGYWGSPLVRKVFRSFPTYMIWDDHEIMDGWGSYTDKELSNKLDTIWTWERPKANLALASDMFAAARATYEEYQHSHNPPTPAGQYDYSFAWGPAAFYVLDTRGRRNYQGGGTNRVLGVEQFERFAAWVEGCDAEVLFVVSAVPVIHARSFLVNKLDIALFGLADDMRDEWDHDSNIEERDRMLDRLFAWSAKHKRKVVVLSGDVHVATAFRLTRSGFPDGEVYQVTSSAITYHLGKFLRASLKLAVKTRGTLDGEVRTSFKRLAVYAGNNFGLIRLDRRDGELEVYYDIYGNGDDGELITVARVQLREDAPTR